MEFLMLIFSIMFVSSPSTAEQPIIGVVTTQHDALNIRSGPGTQYAVVGKAGPGETLWIKKDEECFKGWITTILTYEKTLSFHRSYQ
jgi:uncharacterized protein YraI